MFQECLARHHAQKKAFGHKSEQAFPLNPRRTQAFSEDENLIIDLRT
jgi:hypothetical protein